MSELGTRRARRRQQTRDRIEQVALELFRRDGFGAVTVEDVCRAARVAPATFYRHFACKEDVVFAYRADFSAALADAVTAAAEGCPDHERLGRILAVFTRHLEFQSQFLALRDEIVLRDPDLVRGTLALQRDMENQLAAGLADLRGLAQPDNRARWEAAIGIVVLRMAVRSWRGGESDSLGAAAEQGMARLRELLCVPQPCSTGGSPAPPVAAEERRAAR
jgi:AcrR family transcriptional regulator